MREGFALVFDDHELSDLFFVERGVARSVPSWSPRLVDVAGRDGSVFAGTRAEGVEVAVRLHAMQDTREGRQEAMRALATWLAVDGPRPLFLGDEGGRWRMAVPTDVSDISPTLSSDSVEVRFACPDPLLRGAEREVTVPSGGSATFMVGGTAPAPLSIAAQSARNGSGGYWRVRAEDGRYVIARVASASAVEFDCESRVMRVGGDVAMLEPEADWLWLEPGEHTLSMVGTGAAVVTWTERWW